MKQTDIFSLSFAKLHVYCAYCISRCWVSQALSTVTYNDINLSLTAAAAFDQQLSGHVWSYQVHITPLATRALLLPVHRCATIYRLIYDTSASSGQFKRRLKTFPFGINSTQRTVTPYSSLRDTLTYLLISSLAQNNRMMMMMMMCYCACNLSYDVRQLQAVRV